MEFNKAIEYALDGNAVLFIGSGFGYGATNLSGIKPVTGREFAKQLWGDAGLRGEPESLSLAAQVYVRRHSRAALAELCRDAFTIKSPAPHHVDIASLPWQRIYTTNYDDLLEKSAHEAAKNLTGVIIEDPVERYLGPRICLHINGSISRMNPMDIDSTFKLTHGSYLAETLLRSEWMKVFRQDLRLCKAVIFVGYSMYDLDIQRLVYAEDVSDRSFFVTAPDLANDDLDAIILPTFGKVVDIGVQAFAEQVKAVRLVHAPVKRASPFVELEKVELSLLGAKPANVDLERLFLYGQLSPSLLIAPVSPVDRECIVQREYVSDAVAALNDGSDAVLISDLGNGKTIALEEAARILVLGGWQVYRLIRDNTDSRKELGRLIESADRIVILVDGYVPLLEAIDFVCLRRNDRPIRFLLTSRSPVHDAYRDRLELALRKSVVSEFDVNLLSKSESSALIQVIDNFGLWSDFSARPDMDKERLVRYECGSQIHQVLLKVYKSPQISSRIEEMFKNVPELVKRIVVAVFIIRASGLASDKRLVDDLLTDSPLVHLTNTDRESVRFIWEDTGGKLLIKSSVLAEYYLTTLAKAGDSVQVLIEMFENAHANRRMSKDYEYFMRSVMSFSALQKMLPLVGLRAATVTFYESIQTLAFVAKNPHYWLQYAISRLSFDDSLDDIGLYFDSAYAYARSAGYDTYKIDNHFARFLLKKALVDADPDTAFSHFDEARRIIERQMMMERSHYAFRVAGGVSDFVAARSRDLSRVQRLALKNFCSETLSRISKLPVSLKDHKHVKQCVGLLVAAATRLDGIDD